MKKICLLFICLLLSACNVSKQTQPKLDTPSNVTDSLMHCLFSVNHQEADCYEEFKDLFYEDLNSNATLALFNELTTAVEDATGTNEYTTQIVKLDNGDVYVILFGPDLVKGEFKIQAILPLTDFLQEFNLQ